MATTTITTHQIKMLKKMEKESQTKTDSMLFISDSEDPDNSDYPMLRSRRQKS